MGRVKQNKKSTFIDMTAMSDVTVLLLTFFMLTSTFLAKEPYQPTTPPSVSTNEMPMNNVTQVLLTPDGKVFLTMNNDTAQAISNDAMRIELLENMRNIYNEKNHLEGAKEIKFTAEQQKSFAKLGAFGLPFKDMPEFLSMKPEQQDEWLNGKLPGKKVGIPVEAQTDADKAKQHRTEYQMWIEAVARTSNDSLTDAIKKGTGFALKADQNTPFEVVHMVMDNMQTIGKNKFTLVTTLKTEGE
jgi:biopolymer transport protein ExbD